MKKFTKFAAVLAAMTVPLYAGTLDVKLGAASQKSAGDRAGLNAALAYNLSIDRYFTVAPEIGFNWHSYSETLGANTSGNLTTTTVTSKTNRYYIPAIINAKVMIPMGGNSEWGSASSMITPYFGIGGGYSWMFNNTEKSGTKTSIDLDGLVYQAFVGTYFKIAEDSAVEFLVEAGYRGGKVERGNAQADIAGWFAMGGVKFNLDMGQAASSW